MAITLEQYRARFTEHASVSDDDVEIAIEYANDEVGGEFLGAHFENCQLFYAAHFVEADFVDRSGDASPTGPIASQSADGFSVSFAVSAPASVSRDDFNSTKYGQRYLQIVGRQFGFVEL